MEYGAFLKAADRGEVPSVVLVHGPEPLLLEDALSRVTQGIFREPGEIPLSREVLDATAAGPDAIVRSALTLPFLSARRLVAVRGAEALGPRQGEALAAYAAAPNPATVLLFLSAQELGPGHWLTRAVPAAAAVAAPRPTGRALVTWLRGRAAAAGLELGEEAAALLVQLVGDDLTTLLGEVDKAALAGGPDNRRVAVAQVRAVVGASRLHHVFELTRALERRDLAGALAVLGALLNAGEEPLGVLGMLSREARATWQVKESLRRGRSADEIARALRRPGHAAASLVTLAESLSPGAAAGRLVRCWEVERRLKSGSPPRPELALLVADLCAV